MSRMGQARVRMPVTARPGEILEIRTLVQHPMESGFRLDSTGKPIARHIVESFDCTYDGVEVFRARLHPAVSTNPFFTFYVVARGSGEFVFTWRDDQGGVATARQMLAVE
ncbi:MAG TPA: thiosulfate oxidation carrier complex protein SoxZ [Burkholderiales bacterium]|nr:thiosulfate oxidation carrier complex protein SoxZ [Burkholderiales bacterium]